jgi:hypothetical protein
LSRGDARNFAELADEQWNCGIAPPIVGQFSGIAAEESTLWLPNCNEFRPSGDHGVDDKHSYR